MNNVDDLFEEIRQKLTTISDGNLFEEFATYSLVDSIPGLAPVSGGGDFGRDGEAPSAVLTCTIQSDVIGNMTGSLKQYKNTGGRALTVYVATSQSLSNQRKQNLRKRAEELGFNLPTIYDADYFINALYRDSVWRQKLLGVSGELPALSRIPMTTRTVLDIPMIGRSDALADLEEMQGDVLISGQPGSGKTYIATNFVGRHNGLFVNSDDEIKIANELRQKSPDMLVIDDIHSKESLLTRIKYLRSQLGLNFRIIGVTWASSEVAIKTALGIGDSNILHLKELTRDEIVEVIDACGLKGAARILKREIVNQSKGKPGLAITLSTLCLNGDWEKVFNGDSLYNVVTYSFNAKLGRDVTALLSFIALGGDSGIDLSRLAEVSGTPIPEVKSVLDELAFGGVISSKDDGTVRIEPESLRFPLVRDLFVNGVGALKFENYIEKYPSKNDVIETLLVTVLKGAFMTSSRIKPFMDLNFSAKTWSYYACLGKDEAEYVASNNSGAILAVPGPVLDMQSDIAIRELMNAAVNDHRELHQYPDHPVRILHDWAESAKPGSNTAIKRRVALLRVTNDLLKDGYQDAVTVGRVIAAALNPHYQASETDPGIGMTLTFSRGYISSEEFNEMPELIDSAKKLYEKIDNDKAFVEILLVVEDWVYDRQNVSAEYFAVIKDIKIQLTNTLLTNLRDATKGHYLIQRQIRQLGSAVDMDLGIEIPREYEIIFPYESRRSLCDEALSKKQIDDVKQLAEAWTKENPRQVVEKIVRFQQEANDTHTNYPNYLPYLPPMLAESLPVESLIMWANLFAAHTSLTQFTIGFADEIAKDKPMGYREYLKSMLENDAHSIGAMRAIIIHFTVSDEQELFELAKPLFSKYDREVHIACLRSQVPLKNELFILDNVSEDAAIEICSGIDFEYSKHGNGKAMPEELQKKWQQLIVEHSTINYSVVDNLKSLLKRHPELVLPWFENNINKEFDKNTIWKLHISDIAGSLISLLSIDDRKKLIASLDFSNSNGLLVKALVGEIPELYQTLIDNAIAKDYHLYPLNVFSDNWVTMAQLALSANYTPDEISRNSFHYDFSWTGSEYVMWQGKLAAIESHLKKTSDPAITKIINGFKMNFNDHASKAKEEEYRREVEGI